MERKIKIQLRYPEQKFMKGVYKISFGHGKFYIGKASVLGDRMKQHETNINSVIKNYHIYRNLKAKDGQDYIHTQYVPIAQFILEHPKIEVLTIELITRCVSNEDMRNTEILYLKSMKYNADCVNKSFTTPMKITDDSLWDVEILPNNTINCFDKRIPHLKVNSAAKWSEWNNIKEKIKLHKNTREFKRIIIGEQVRRMQSMNLPRDLHHAYIDYFAKQLLANSNPSKLPF